MRSSEYGQVISNVFCKRNNGKENIFLLCCSRGTVLVRLNLEKMLSVLQQILPVTKVINVEWTFDVVTFSLFVCFVLLLLSSTLSWQQERNGQQMHLPAALRISNCHIALLTNKQKEISKNVSYYIKCMTVYVLNIFLLLIYIYVLYLHDAVHEYCSVLACICTYVDTCTHTQYIYILY